jgi:hypothetical protein
LKNDVFQKNVVYINLFCFYIGTTDAFWIGLWNTTWLSGSIFDNLYGLHTSKILHESEPSNSCAGLRFNAGNPYIIRSVACINATKSLCELPIPP